MGTATTVPSTERVSPSMRLPHSIGFVVTGVAVAALALAGCSSSTGTDTTDDNTIAIVASTNAYGDIATQIGGDLVSVSSIISDPSQDPHSYEGNAQVQLSLSKADIVIENGAGYDDFVDTLLAGASNDEAILLNAADISGYNQEPAESEFNEHVWYDFPTMQKLATELSVALSDLDPDNAATFESNAVTFIAALSALAVREAAIAASSTGTGVAITEPVPLYLLEAAGLVNVTPEEFSEAIEEGGDVSPTVLQETLNLFTDGSVALLAYNAQTTGAETEQLLAAAEDAGVAVVPVTETMPDDEDYLSWQSGNLDAIEAALS